MKLELYLKNRKYLIILFSSLFIFVVLFLYLFYFGKNTNMKKNTSSDFFKKNGQDLGRNLEKKVDNKEIAKSIVEWLKKMENKVALQCSNKECTTLGTDRQREIGSIWAFFNYYLYSKD